MPQHPTVIPMSDDAKPIVPADVAPTVLPDAFLSSEEALSAGRFHLPSYDELPSVELYRDQVLSYIDHILSPLSACSEGLWLTASMVNNYVKEGLMTPVRGKKYTRQQIMQLLCVYHLKQNLRLSDVKALTGRDDVDFWTCYAHLLEDKKKIRESVPAMLDAFLPYDSEDPNGRLMLCLALSEIASYLRRLCEGVVDAIDEQTGGKE